MRGANWTARLPSYSDRLNQQGMLEERQRIDAMIADPWRQKFRAKNPRMQYDPEAESAKSTAALDAYDDPVRRNLAAGTRALGIPDFTGHNLIAAAEFLPGVGDALDAQDSALAFGKGDYLTGGLLGGAAAIGLVPGVGDALGGAIGGMVKGTGKAADALTDARKGIRAYHGSPHDFDQFDISKIGTGEGAQAYGHGLYFAEAEDTARAYRDALRYPRIDGATDIVGQVTDDLNYHRGNAEELANIYRQMIDSGDAAAKAMGQAKLDALPSVQAANPGHMYEVNINADPEDFLDWDKPLSEQPESVRRAMVPLMGPKAGERTGRELYDQASSWDSMANVASKFADEGQAREMLATMYPNATQQAIDNAIKASEQLADNQRISSEIFREAGIPGIKYLDQGSRAAGEGSRNYVVFDDKLVSLIRKYGLAALLAGGGMGAWGMAPEGGEPPPL